MKAVSYPSGSISAMVGMSAARGTLQEGTPAVCGQSPVSMVARAGLHTGWLT